MVRRAEAVGMATVRVRRGSPPAPLGGASALNALTGRLGDHKRLAAGPAASGSLL